MTKSGKLTFMERKPKIKKADVGGKVGKGNLKDSIPKGKPHYSRNLIQVRGIGRYSCSALCTGGSIQKVNSGFKRKRRFLLLSQNQLEVIVFIYDSTQMV